MNPVELIECDFGGRFPFRPQFVNVGSHRMHYVDVGSGEPVVLLHGNPTWGYLYRKFIRPLAGHERVIVPDYLGFGKSDKPLHESYRLTDRVEHLNHLLTDELDLKNVTLVVQDWGGPIGLGYAVRNPGRVRRLVIMNTWCHRFEAGTRLFPALEQLRTPGIGEAFVQGLNIFVEGLLPAGIYRKERITEDLLDAYRAPFPDFNSRRHVLRFPRDIPVGEDHPSYEAIGAIEERLASLDVHALILWGKKDPVFPGAMLERWTETYPRAEVQVIDDAGHFLQEDAPGEILAQLEKFLGS